MTSRRGRILAAGDKKHYWAAFLLAFLLVINLFLLNIDDVAIAYAPHPNEAIIAGNISNYRFTTAAISIFTAKLGFDYYSIVGFWILIFSAAIFASSYATVSYVGFPQKVAPIFVLLLGMHGYWADLHQFTMGYGNYAVALLAIAVALIFTWRFTERSYSSVFVCTLSGLVALTTYQPFIWVLLLAPALACVNQVLVDNARFRALVADIVPPIAGFCISFFIFLVLRYVIHSNDWLDEGHVRPLSFAAVLDNVILYVKSIVDPFLGRRRFWVIFPIHERLLYATAAVSLLSIIILRILRGSKDSYWALAALIGAVLISANPINAAGKVFWPSPRSISHAAFLHVGLLIIISRLVFAKIRIEGALLGSICLVVLLSLANQMSLLFERYRQTLQDKAIGALVLLDLKAAGGLYAGAKIDVMSTFNNVAQLNRVPMFDYGLSALTVRWSSVPALRMLSGVALVQQNAPEATCVGAKAPWEVRKIENIYAICMP